MYTDAMRNDKERDSHLEKLFREVERLKEKERAASSLEKFLQSSDGQSLLEAMEKSRNNKKYWWQDSDD